MPPVALTGFFQTDNGYGWSETHHSPGSAEPINLAPLLTQFRQIMIDQRRPLLGRDGFYIGCRASYRTSTGRIASAPILETPGKPGTQGVLVGAVVQPTWTTSQEAAAKLRMGNAGQTAFSDIYLRGFWDVVESAGELDFTSTLGANWKSLADAYVAALVQAGYGWLGIDPALTTRGNVTDYTIDVDQHITFTIAVTQGPVLPAVGTRIAVRIARLNNSKSVLNETHVVTVLSPTTFRTVQPTAAGSFTGPGTFTYSVKSFLAYQAVQYWKLARRACGRPFGLSRGRSRVRARN